MDGNVERIKTDEWSAVIVEHEGQDPVVLLSFDASALQNSGPRRLRAADASTGGA